MTFLPIVERELRVTARQSITYWSRLSGAAFTLLIMVLMWWNMTAMPSRILGYEIFQLAVSLNFVYCLTSVHLTADSISREKREGTLGFLFLTDLKGYDIVLGKLAVTSLRSFYGLFAILPMLTIPLLVGGVTMADVARAGLVLLNTMFFSLSAGMFVSVLCRDARKAAGLAFGLVLAITAGLPAIGGIIAAVYRVNPFNELAVFFLPSPGVALYLALSPVAMNRSHFYLASGITLGWSLVFLTLASRLVSHFWQDKPASALRARWRDRLHETLQGDPATRAGYRRRLLDLNPILWLCSRNRLRPYYTWIFLAVLGCIWLWGFWAAGIDWLATPVAVIFILLIHTLLKLGMAAQAGERFGEDLRSGALELVLSTRSSVEELIQGQLLALRRHFVQPVTCVLVADALLVLAALAFNPDAQELTDQFYFGLSAVAAMILLVMDLVALGWVGMWMGMASRNHKRAAGETVSRVLVLPWMGVLLVNSLVGFANWYWRLHLNVPFLVMLGLWFGLSLVVNVTFKEWAANNLRTRFRALAMQRYLPEQPHRFWTVLGTAWGRLWSKLARGRL